MDWEHDGVVTESLFCEGAVLQVLGHCWQHMFTEKVPQERGQQLLFLMRRFYAAA